MQNSLICVSVFKEWSKFITKILYVYYHAMQASWMQLFSKVELGVAKN